jgi:hypothetical protein
MEHKVCHAIAFAMLITSSHGASADRGICQAVLTAAFKAPTNIEACQLAHTESGDIIGYLSGNALYLARKDRTGTHLVEMKLLSATMTEKPTNQSMVDKPWSRKSPPDAKQMYFPFDVNNRIRDAAGQPGNGFVCIDPKSAHLTVKTLRASICKVGP